MVFYYVCSSNELADEHIHETTVRNKLNQSCEHFLLRLGLRVRVVSNPGSAPGHAHPPPPQRYRLVQPDTDDKRQWCGIVENFNCRANATQKTGTTVLHDGSVILMLPWKPEQKGKINYVRLDKQRGKSIVCQQ